MPLVDLPPKYQIHFTSKIQIQINSQDGFSYGNETNQTLYYPIGLFSTNNREIRLELYEMIIIILGFFAVVAIFLFNFLFGNFYQIEQISKIAKKWRDFTEIGLDPLEILEQDLSSDMLKTKNQDLLNTTTKYTRFQDQQSTLD